jgi:putative transposase
MSRLQYQEAYRRHLPHFQPRGFSLFITFRLANSLPIDVVERLGLEARHIQDSLFGSPGTPDNHRQREHERQELFEKWDDALHTTRLGKHYLKDDRVATIVANSIRYHDGDWFDLDAYCIMPNHVHLVLTPRQQTAITDFSLAKIMHNIKRSSSKQANLILGLSGAFWQHESYDHVIRDDAEFERIVRYVLYNPVKADLVEDPTEWQWSYSKTEL